jgi:hypothetical protein
MLSWCDRRAANDAHDCDVLARRLAEDRTHPEAVPSTMPRRAKRERSRAFTTTPPTPPKVMR